MFYVVYFFSSSPFTLVWDNVTVTELCKLRMPVLFMVRAYSLSKVNENYIFLNHKRQCKIKSNRVLPTPIYSNVFIAFGISLSYFSDINLLQTQIESHYI
jgi:hypothetical protein